MFVINLKQLYVCTFVLDLYFEIHFSNIGLFATVYIGSASSGEIYSPL